MSKEFNKNKLVHKYHKITTPFYELPDDDNYKIKKLDKKKLKPE